MATVKITELPSITGAVATSTDVIPLVDVSLDVTSKITREEFFRNIPNNVGIGTSAPSRPLHVVTTGATIASSLFQNDTGSCALFFRSDDAGSNTIYFGDVTDFQAGFISCSHANSNLTTRSEGAFIVQTGGAVESMRITATGNVGIGTNNPNAASIVDAQSTTKGVRFPNMTTAQKNAIANVAGNVIFDTTLGKLCVNTGSGWETITSA